MAEQVDYDAIAPSYNRRFEDQAPSGTLLALQDLARTLGVGLALEVGCGTGHWLVELSDLTRGRYGLDFSSGMLAQAHQADITLPLVQGRAEELPFPDGMFDLVYCVNAIHHFQRQSDFIKQAYRVLKPGGALAVLGMDPRHYREDWYVYEYFDGVFDTDLARFPAWGRVMDWMLDAGFERVEFRQVDEEGSPKLGAAVLEDPFLVKSSCSQLALLTDQAYADGLDRIRGALAEAEAQGRQLVFQNTIRIYQMVGCVGETASLRGGII